MRALAMAGHGPAAIDLNQPGSYLHWNVFTISVANLVLIAVMVVIFGAALLLPFPKATAAHGAAGLAGGGRTGSRRAPDPSRWPRGMSGCGRRGCAAAR